MEANPPSPSKRSLVSRTSVITMLAIGGVALAGSAAIAANIGILNSTDDGEIGALSAADFEPTTTTTVEDQIIDVYLDEPASSAPSSSAPTTTAQIADDRLEQLFTVDDAGSVTLAAAEGLLQVTDIAPTTGWVSTASQDAVDALTISFTDGQRTVVLTASLAADGTILADVTEPIVVTRTVPPSPAVGAPATPTPVSTVPNGSQGSYDDDHDDDHDDEFDDDHDDEFDDEFDEVDDDDDDDDDDQVEEEYEGRDDDD